MESNTPNITEVKDLTPLFKSALGLSGCYVESVGTLMQSLDESHVEVDGKFIKITPEVAVGLMGKLFRELQNSMLVCEGKELQIQLGDSPLSNLLETVIEFILKYADNVNKQ